MHRTQEQWIEAYMAKQALWIHDGNLKRPHVKLRSELHSSGFFDSRPLINDDHLLKEAAEDLIELLDRDFPNSLMTDGFVGPKTGATKLAQFLKEEAERKKRISYLNSSPSKVQVEGENLMVFSPEEIPGLYGKKMTLCEDVLTTGGSIICTENALIKAKASARPMVLVLVNRSGLREVSGKRIISLIDVLMPQWTEKECLLCPQGSKAISDPKDHWDELTAIY